MVLGAISVFCAVLREQLLDFSNTDDVGLLVGFRIFGKVFDSITDFERNVFDGRSFYE